LDERDENESRRYEWCCDDICDVDPMRTPILRQIHVAIKRKKLPQAEEHDQGFQIWLHGGNPRLA
jgi:hypothetical protein